MLVLLMVAVTGAVAQSTYKVSVKEGTEDAEKWTIEPTEAAAGTQVTVTYSGLKKVKSDKAVKKAAAPAEEPDTPNAEYNWVHINMKVNGGERYNIDPNTGTAGFTNGDSIYVSNGGKYRGVLTYSNGTFTGDLAYNDENPMDTDDYLHFYFFGGTNLEITFNKPTLFQTTLNGVDISVQSERLPILSYGKSTTPYSNSSTTYSTTLENQCALVEFTTNRILKETNFYIQGINNQVAIDFENNTITTTNTTGNISLYPETPTSRWAILLPNEDSVTVTVNAVGYNEIDITIPPVHKNDFLHGKNAVSFELTATDADKPLTMMMMAPEGTIRVINPPVGMKYEKFEWIVDNNYNSYGKQTINGESEISIDVNQNDKVSFYGNGTSIKDYSSTNIVSTNDVELSGNIMSLVDENYFAKATSMVGASFAGLFAGNNDLIGNEGNHIIDVSSLLLPATTLSENCYSGMFAGCSRLSGGPAELPALTLAPGCYSNMFKGCDQVMWAQTLVLPATELVDRCYFNMFDGCGNLYKLTCLATTIKGTDCTTNWLNGVSNTSPDGVPTFTKAKDASFWTLDSSDGIPWGWTVNEEVEYYNVVLTDGGLITALDTYKGLTIDVAYSRSFTNGKPSTVCLPFAYTKKTGDGSFYEFTNIEKNSSGEYVATMTDPGVSTLTANTPYLYLPNATGDVDFSGTYAIPTDLTAGSTTSNGWTFKGTYTGEEWETAPATPTYGFSAGDANDGIKQGQFVKVGDYVRIKPLRCYLENASFAGARGMTRAAAEPLPETIKVRLISANGEVTGIGTISTKTGEGTIDSGAWYSLDGRRIEGKPSTKGVYVNNGKKVIINK